MALVLVLVGSAAASAPFILEARQTVSTHRKELETVRFGEEKAAAAIREREVEVRNQQRDLETQQLRSIVLEAIGGLGNPVFGKPLVQSIDALAFHASRFEDVDLHEGDLALAQGRAYFYLLHSEDFQYTGMDQRRLWFQECRDHLVRAQKAFRSRGQSSLITGSMALVLPKGAPDRALYLAAEAPPSYFDPETSTLDYGNSGTLPADDIDFLLIALDELARIVGLVE